MVTCRTYRNLVFETLNPCHECSQRYGYKRFSGLAKYWWQPALRFSNRSNTDAVKEFFLPDRICHTYATLWLWFHSTPTGWYSIQNTPFCLSSSPCVPDCGYETFPRL
ncbi:hypothetical protein BDN67DRAFT_206487 [Paxillus ammoniavirescens]|nr:hypothetical protein BDN67DRAFT_206487 [Paxillus ammoniavirescens]